MGTDTLHEIGLHPAATRPWREIKRSIDSIDLNFASEPRAGGVHGLHPYPAKFTGHLPAALLEATLASRGDVVDPFCGSGTTLVEAMRRGHASCGLDANPIALLVTKAKTSRLTVAGAASLDRAAKSVVQGMRLPDADDNPRVLGRNNGRVRHWFPPHTFAELKAIDAVGQRQLPEDLLILWRAALSALMVRVSHQDQETRYAWVDKEVKPWDTVRAFRKKLQQAMPAMLAASEDYERSGAPIAVVNSVDFSLEPVDLGSAKFDVAIFSPPYPNTFDYHLYHRLRLLFFGHDPKQLRVSEMGAHLKYDEDTASYLSAMRTMFTSLFRALRPGGVAAMVVGDSVVRGRVYQNGEDLLGVAEQLGFVKIAAVQRQIPPGRKSFSRSAERLREETVLVLGRPPKGSGKARERAGAATTAPGDEADSNQEQLELFGSEASYHCGYPLQPLEKQLADEFIKSASKTAVGRSLITLGPFFHRVRRAKGGLHGSVATLQGHLDRSGSRFSKCTTYFGHGIHGYVGKFYPQIARQLLLLDLVKRERAPRDVVVFDPFCGSGTTLVEASIVGCASHGVDLNPLACLIASAKLELLRSGLPAFRKEGESLLAVLETLRGDRACSAWSSEETKEYLASWFPKQQLAEVSSIYSLLRQRYGAPLQEHSLFYALLSSILRACSLQRPGDLRVRRRPEGEVEVRPLVAMRARVVKLLRDCEKWEAASKELPAHHRDVAASASVICGDARSEVAGFTRAHRTRDVCIVTSPPYAAALPYVDTDRLSLSALELWPDGGGQRGLERRMIGNREIASSDRRAALDAIEGGQHRELGSESLVGFLEGLVSDLVGPKAEAGFRKLNNPAIVLAYFQALSEVMKRMATDLKKGTTCYVLVGGNKMHSGRRVIYLDTPQVLCEVAVAAGWKAGRLHAKELTSADNRKLVHRKAQAMSEEAVLEFRL